MLEIWNIKKKNPSFKIQQKLSGNVLPLCNLGGRSSFLNIKSKKMTSVWQECQASILFLAIRLIGVGELDGLGVTVHVEGFLRGRAFVGKSV